MCHTPPAGGSQQAAHTPGTSLVFTDLEEMAKEVTHIGVMIVTVALRGFSRAPYVQHLDFQNDTKMSGFEMRFSPSTVSTVAMFVGAG